MTTVRTSTDDQVLYVTLDGPGSMNSLTPPVLQELDDAIAVVERDRSLRAIVITGTGKAFSVGMDIDFLGECFADPAGVFLPFIRRFHEVLLRLENCGVPSIAVVNGLARAGGFELLLACDFVIAADEAKVGDTHSQFGMIPGAGASVRAPRKVGDQRARELLLAGRWLTGPEMVQWGLAVASVPRDDLAAETDRLLAGIRGRSRRVLGDIKNLLNATPELSLLDALRLEREVFARFLAEDEQFDEGYRAFVEGREPHWGER
jgi:enoyl-CoA hydratase/carnithine racemase